MLKIYSQKLDSACTATAYLSGIKTNDGEIGVNAKTSFGNCTDNLNTSNHVDSIATWFQNANRSSGVVTTTRITHAVIFKFKQCYLNHS